MTTAAEPREPLAVEFANTHYAVRGRIRDGIASTEELTDWLRAHEAGLGVAVRSMTEGQAAGFVALRDALRGLIGASVAAEQVREADLACLNEAAAAAPVWPRLSFGADGFSAAEATDHPAVPAALAALARAAVALLSGPTRDDLRACHAPGCVQFFVKDHPRREWCSAACGNRARAARHYQRHRED
jgi:predicted RNA-binding Zn ribbon-like protein